MKNLADLADLADIIMCPTIIIGDLLDPDPHVKKAMCYNPGQHQEPEASFVAEPGWISGTESMGRIRAGSAGAAEAETDHNRMTKRDLNIVKISEWSARESLTNYVDYGSLKFILIQYF